MADVAHHVRFVLERICRDHLRHDRSVPMPDMQVQTLTSHQRASATEPMNALPMLA